MQTNKADFKHYAAELLRELATTAIQLDITFLAYLIAMAAQEAGETRPAL